MLLEFVKKLNKQLNNMPPNKKKLSNEFKLSEKHLQKENKKQ